MHLFQKKLYQAKGIECRQSPLHGRGVFACIPFAKGQLIEIAPVILLTPGDKDLLGNTDLYGYYFLTKSEQYPAVFGLGFSSLYNHSGSANAAYHIDMKRKYITINAWKSLVVGEEITLNYNGNPDDNSPVYF